MDKYEITIENLTTGNSYTFTYVVPKELKTTPNWVRDRIARLSGGLYKIDAVFSE